MMPFGPQAGSGYLSPTPQQPQPMDPMQQWSMQNDAQQQAVMHGMRGMLNNQYQGNLMGAGMLGARAGNQALGNPIGAVLRPVGQAVKAGASSLMGGAAQQSYNVGGPTTLGAASANSAGLTGQTAAPAATASTAGPSLSSSASGALSIAGAAYGAYEGMHSAQEALRRLHEATSYGIQPEQEAQLRQGTFNSGMQSAVIGSHAGALGGFAYGPVGAVAGGLLGGAGGARQAWDSYDTNPERFQAQLKFQENPFRR